MGSVLSGSTVRPSSISIALFPPLFWPASPDCHCGRGIAGVRAPSTGLAWARNLDPSVADRKHRKEEWVPQNCLCPGLRAAGDSLVLFGYRRHSKSVDLSRASDGRQNQLGRAPAEDRSGVHIVHRARRSAGRPNSARRIPNGCFIESLAQGRALAREGKVLGRPQLVAYYSPQRVAGHCVLAYETAQGIFIVDSEAGPWPRWVGRGWPDDLAALIRASRPELKALSSVRSFPLELPVRPAVAAAAESPNDREKS
jgi:hypothetical protein